MIYFDKESCDLLSKYLLENNNLPHELVDLIKTSPQTDVNLKGNGIKRRSATKRSKSSTRSTSIRSTSKRKRKKN